MIQRSNILLCAADDTDPTALAFVKSSIERWDDLLEVVTERAWDRHDGGSNKGGDRGGKTEEFFSANVAKIIPGCRETASRI